MLLTGFAIFSLAVVIIIIGIAALALPKNRNGTSTVKLCETETCRDFVHWVGLELDGHPCEDFAAFVCSDFKKLLAINISVADDVAVRSALYHGRLLESGKDTFDITKPAAMFKSCLVRTEEDDRRVSRTLHDLMREQNLFWPEAPRSNISGLKVAKIIVDLAVNWVLPLWFNIVLIPANGTMPRFIYVSPSNLGKVWYPLHTYTLGEIVSYKSYWEFFIRSLPPEYRVDVSAQTINKMRDTHGYILQRLFISASRSHPEPVHFKLKDLSGAYKYIVPTDWVDALQAALRAAPSINSDDRIFFTDQYLLNMTNDFFQRYPEETLLAQLSWWAVQIIGSIVSKVAINQLLSGVAEEHLGLLCSFEVETVYALLLAATDVASKFTRENRTYIDTFFDGIVKSAMNKIRTASWIERNSKKAFLSKLQKMTTSVWPSETYLTEHGLHQVYKEFPKEQQTFIDFWITSRRALHSLRDSGEHREAYTFPKSIDANLLRYNYVSNDVSLYLASLSAPFYYPGATKTMMYSGIGALYANELVRSIDPYGACFDSIIDEETESNTMNEYISKVSCPSSLPPGKLCPPNSAKGIFPQVPALEILYSAFLKDLNNTEELGMWKMEKFSTEQIFFIGTCFSLCHGGRLKNLEACNRAMRNFAPFSQAFNCPLGSHMNPPKKCTFF